MYIATKTLQAINNAIEKDNGNTYRSYLGQVIPHIGDAYRVDNMPFRTHLGASLIGQSCGLKLWFSFRWFKKPSFDARMQRLFNRGHLEEARFIALLLAAGIQVYQQDENGKQFRISDCSGHFGGSGDGIIVGCPDLPLNVRALSEFKTHNDKSFTKLTKEGVRSAKPEHYVQMQIYMHKMNLNYALYLAVNKNDDSLHGEIIVRDDVTALKYIDRAENIIFCETVPSKYSMSQAHFVCKICDYKNICHNRQSFEKNCRTCMFGKPVKDSKWQCDLHNKTIDEYEQFNGCDRYEALKL